MSGKEVGGALIAVLDRHRAALQALPGVVGSGVGISQDAQSTDDVTVQVFVGDPADVMPVRDQARAILGQVPLEVVVTGEVVAGDA